jgi:hypothetical protein
MWMTLESLERLSSLANNTSRSKRLKSSQSLSKSIQFQSHFSPTFDSIFAWSDDLSEHRTSILIISSISHRSSTERLDFSDRRRVGRESTNPKASLGSFMSFHILWKESKRTSISHKSSSKSNRLDESRFLWFLSSAAHPIRTLENVTHLVGSVWHIWWKRGFERRRRDFSTFPPSSSL